MANDEKSVILVMVLTLLITIATYSYVWQNNLCVGTIGQDIDENGNLEVPVCNYSKNINILENPKTSFVLIFIILILVLITCYNLIQEYSCR
jgi:uncharacterized membrane protein